jgi:hypothetical protein
MAGLTRKYGGELRQISAAAKAILMNKEVIASLKPP